MSAYSTPSPFTRATSLPANACVSTGGDEATQRDRARVRLDLLASRRPALPSRRSGTDRALASSCVPARARPTSCSGACTRARAPRPREDGRCGRCRPLTTSTCRGSSRSSSSRSTGLRARIVTSTSRSAALEGPLVGDRQRELDLGIARGPRADDDEERERCGRRSRARAGGGRARRRARGPRAPRTR